MVGGAEVHKFKSERDNFLVFYQISAGQDIFQEG